VGHSQDHQGEAVVIKLAVVVVVLFVFVSPTLTIKFIPNPSKEIIL
jgi:hypothetical protein